MRSARRLPHGGDEAQLTKRHIGKPSKRGAISLRWVRMPNTGHFSVHPRGANGWYRRWDHLPIMRGSALELRLLRQSLSSGCGIFVVRMFNRAEWRRGL